MPARSDAPEQNSLNNEVIAALFAGNRGVLSLKNERRFADSQGGEACHRRAPTLEGVWPDSSSEVNHLADTRGLPPDRSGNRSVESRGTFQNVVHCQY
jgi:hypothetical protein